MNDLKARFQAAADQYVAKTREEADVIGIVVSGSFVHSRLDPNSDIDIYVIMDPSNTERERGNTWINGVEIEYFKNPPQQIQAYFRKEKSPHTAHILANGQLVYKGSTVVETIIKEAKEVLANSRPALKEFQIELLKYHLDDLYKDLADCIYHQDPFASKLIKFEIINRCIEAFCQVHRIHATKRKRLIEQLDRVDPEFSNLLQDYTQADWDKNLALDALIAKMAKILGGKRNKEWRLRSSLDL